MHINIAFHDGTWNDVILCLLLANNRSALNDRRLWVGMLGIDICRKKKKGQPLENSVMDPVLDLFEVSLN